VTFEQAAEEKLITDKDEIARAKAGPDVHCAFCGARNPAKASKCSQCGADLSAATARESGQVLGAHRDGPAGQVKCPQCGAFNSASAFRCTQCNASLPRPPARRREPQPAAGQARTSAQRRVTGKTPTQKRGKNAGVLTLLGILLFALVACAAIAIIASSMTPSMELTGQVQAVSWTRSIRIEELGNVTKEAWFDGIPSGARVGMCTKKHRHTQDEPAPNATEVCGTPYTVDKGTGHGEVVQDCQYKVYADWCEYTVRAWKAANEVTSEGSDLDPRWPDPDLGVNRREAERKEVYRVRFDTEQGTYTYSTSDVNNFLRFTIGSRWTLKVSPMGGVSPIGPAQ
jgi:ribosomal protein L40E